MENRKEFLYNAISDAQELIKFIDAKTTIVITILGAYAVTMFTAIDKIIEYSNEYSFWFWLILISFNILLVLCILIITRIINPTNNPKENILLPTSHENKLSFFLTPNDYSKYKFYPFSNSKKNKLKLSYDDYAKQISDSDEAVIINTLTLELLKVSFIRNIKNDRFKVLLRFLLATTIVFLLNYICYLKETKSISKNLEEKNKIECPFQNVIHKNNLK